MLDKGRYLELCAAHEETPIFSRPFWLDAVCGERHWDAAVVERGGHILGAMPFYIRRRLGITCITMPPLTQNLSLWLAYPPEADARKRLSVETDVTADIISSLPRFDVFGVNFYRSMTNWLPFYWKGFSQTTRYTYVIEDLSDLGRVSEAFSYAKKKNLRRAEGRIRINLELSPKAFYENHRMTLRMQGVAINYTQDILQRIHDAVRTRDCGRIIGATDSEGNLHAALFVVWDEVQAYNLISTIDPHYRNSGAATLAVWHAVQHVATRTRKFDFEGSMIPGVERSFRQFGTAQVPYFRIARVPSRVLRAVLCLRGKTG